MVQARKKGRNDRGGSQSDEHGIGSITADQKFDSGEAGYLTSGSPVLLRLAD